MFRQARNWVLDRAWALLLGFYLFTRFSHFGRDLTFEEGVFLRPGREFWLGNGYLMDMGLTTRLPEMLSNPFHKPPLTSLLLGAASFLGTQPIASARLVPVVVGLWLLFLGRKLTGGLLASWVLALSPFFFGASAHMQTDPTVGLLGYGLLLLAIQSWVSSRGRRGGELLVLVFLVLFNGKLEIAMIAGAVLGLVGLLPTFPNRLVWFAWGGLSSILGTATFCLVTYLLGLQIGLGWSDSVGAVVGTVTRITGGLVQEASHSGGHRRAVIRDALASVQFGWFWGLAFFPVFLTVVDSFRFVRKNRFAALVKAFKEYNLYSFCLWIAAFVPYLVYMRGGYTGDGFPRYFLIVALPLALLAGQGLMFLKGGAARAAQVFAVLICVLVFAPNTFRLWKSPGSVSSGRGFTGGRIAAELLAALTKPNDLVIGNEYHMPYVPERRWLVLESFTPYPAESAKALPFAPQVRGAILGLPTRGSPERYSGVLGQIAKQMESRGAKSLPVPGGEVLYFEKGAK